MPSNQDIEYTDEFITKLQIAFGKGFLSPGGMEEVAKIVEGIDLSGKKILDIGVGIGGPAYSYMVATLGQDDADDWLARADARAVISEQGQLRPGHIRGHKPI